MSAIKNILIISLSISLISCQDDKAKQQYEKDKKAIESEVGKMIESSKQVAEDLAVKAQEQADQAVTVIEDTAVEIQEGAEEVQEDLENAITD